MKKNKSDSIVWDDVNHRYFAKLLPYSSNLSGPIIEVPNIGAFKKKGVDRVSKQFQAELTSIQEKIKSFVSIASDTEKVYSSDFNFEPIVGEKYFLYKGEKNTFLSIIEPNCWNKECLGTFRLDSDYKWIRI